MSEPQAIEHAYQSAYQSALIVQHDPPGVIELRGADRVDLLHRLSTNNLEGMQVDRVLRTVFTDPVGRTIDVVTVLTLSEKLLLVTSSGRSQIMQDWLQRHIFFQDDVTVHVSEGEWSLYGTYGPKAADSVASAIPPEGALIVNDHGIIWPIDQPVAGFQRLVRPDQTVGDWVASANAADAFEILRIEAGLPKIGAEILEDSIPLEVGLWDAVSFEKGCYVGQEIIARMESRGKLAKQLVGVRLESQAEPGSALRQGDQTVGTLTSVVQSPRLGWIGLASGRPSALAAEDGRVGIGESGETAFMVELPFAALEAPAPA
ncbi:MAG: YgfZ/GcvT domain-containing protein [Anaerolineales bacterium]